MLEDEMLKEPSREAIDKSTGPMLLEFGASWCGHCRKLKPGLALQLSAFPQVRHVKVEDGPGQPLGRSFGVKLWPTLVLLRDGRVALIAVRPHSGEIRSCLEAITH